MPPLSLARDIASVWLYNNQLKTAVRLRQSIAISTIACFVFFLSLSGPDKHDDDDLVFEDFARLRLKESEHLGSADA